MRQDFSRNQQTALTNDNVILSPIEFINSISKGGPKAHLGHLVPDIFWDQAAAGVEDFIITSQMFTDRIISIPISDAVLTSPDSVAVVMRFQAKVRTTRTATGTSYNLVPLQAGGNSPEPWLGGFRSIKIELGPEQVQQGMLTAEEITCLQRHAAFYKAVGKEAYNTSRNEGGFGHIRPYLTAKPNRDGEFYFRMVTRPNPQTHEEAIGIVVNSWTPGDFHLIGAIDETETIGGQKQSLQAPVRKNKGTWSYTGQ